MVDDKVIEIQGLLKQLREKYEDFQKNVISKADFEQIEEKINNRIDALETALNRPAAGGVDVKDGTKARAFFEYVRKGKAEMPSDLKTALVASDDTSGVLIPAELESEIQMALPNITVMRNLCTVMPVNSDRLRRRSLTNVTVGWGKLEASVAADLDDFESSVTAGEAYIHVENLNGLIKLGEDLLADSDVMLESILRDAFANAMAEAEDDAFVMGEGHSAGEPEGIVAAKDASNDPIVPRVETVLPGEITVDDLIELEYKVPAKYKKNAAFIMSSATEKLIRKLKAQGTDSGGSITSNIPLWEPSIQSGRPATLMGYPVYNNDFLPEPVVTAGSAGKDVIIFGNFKLGYVILDRAGMSVQRLTELYAEQDLVGLKVKKRVGGGIVRPDAMAVLRLVAPTSTSGT